MHKRIAESAKTLHKVAVEADFEAVSGELNTSTGNSQTTVRITVEKGNEHSWSFEALWFDENEKMYVTSKVTYENADNIPF